MVKSCDSASALAQAAGISEGALRKYLAGAEPTRVPLVALARAGEVSVQWLATGEGAMRGSTDAPVNQSLTADLVRDAVLELERYLAAARRTLTPEKKARLVVLLCEQFSQSGNVSEKIVRDLAELAS